LLNSRIQIADRSVFLFLGLLSHTTELQIADGSIFVSFQSILVFQDKKRRQLDEISDPDSHGPTPQFDDNRKGTSGFRHSEFFSDPVL
jgi:hypothetical protein